MLLILFMAQYRANGTVRSYLHLKTDLLRYSIFLQNLRARISPPWSARSYINLESSPYFPVSTCIGFAYYIVLLRDETSSSVFCLSYPDMMWKIINWIRDSISIIFHEGSNKRGCLCLAQKKGQSISIDEGHLFMRCFCSSNCFLKRTILICLILLSGLKAYCVKWCMIDFSNSSYKTVLPLWVQTLACRLFQPRDVWRSKWSCQRPGRFFWTLVQQKINDLVLIEIRVCRLPVHEQENPVYFKPGRLPRMGETISLLIDYFTFSLTAICAGW